MLVTGGLFLPSASCDQGGHRLWTSAIRRQPQYGLTQNPVLVTLTSDWPRNSVAGVEERRLEYCHLLSCYWPHVHPY